MCTCLVYPGPVSTSRGSNCQQFETSCFSLISVHIQNLVSFLQKWGHATPTVVQFAFSLSHTILILNLNHTHNYTIYNYYSYMSAGMDSSPHHPFLESCSSPPSFFTFFGKLVNREPLCHIRKLAQLHFSVWILQCPIFVSSSIFYNVNVL